jgi:hypothetical protein
MLLLHLGVQNCFGVRSEKLAMFGLQSLRRRKKFSKRPENSEDAPEISAVSEE